MDRPKVAGLAGVILFADKADTLAHWYEEHLGLFFTREPDSHQWWCDVPGGTSFAIHQTRHQLGHERRHCEIAWEVEDIDAYVIHLGELGVTVDERSETPSADFAWLDDPEGNRIELVMRRK